MKEIDAVLHRISQLRQLHSYRDREKELIRAVCSGPEEGLKALLGDLNGVNPYSVPAANLVLSGMQRLAQKIGRPPDLRIDPPINNDKERARKAAEKRARIQTSWDEQDDLEGLLYQSGMWLPGYAFTAWVVKEGVTDDGHPYPQTINLDPYGTYPAASVHGRQPSDLAYVYQVSARDLVERYPEHRIAILGQRTSGGAVLLDPFTYPASTGSWSGGGSQWNSPGGGALEVAEYYDRDGCWVCVPEKKLVLEYYPNPLESGPQFVVTSRFSFNRPVGQYDHTLGLQASIAHFGSLAVLALKEGVFAERNITGEVLSGQYRTGYRAVNYLSPGSTVERPTTNLPYQLFQEVDRLERQFRTTAGYAVTDDAVSPAAQATGQGIDRLNAGIDLEVKQYLSRLRRSLQLRDRKQQEWMDRNYPTQTIPIAGVRGGSPFAETYTPGKDIKGDYRTRRTYGAMAGLDDSQKIVGLLQLVQGDLLDRTSAIEELDLGGRSVTQIEERIEDGKIRRTLMEAMATGAPMDPRVAMTLIEMLPESEFKTAAKKFWTPDEPEMSPEEEAMAMGGPPAGPLGPPPLPAEVMALLAGGGGGMPPDMGAPPGGIPMPEGAVA